MVEGDRNTKYYHTKTIIRRRRNKIIKLRRPSGEWIDNQEDLKTHVILHFQSRFQEPNRNRNCAIDTNNFYPPLKEDSISKLRAYVTPEKIEQAVFAMGSLKAPGNDGLPANFYKENWVIVANSLKEFVMHSWQVPKAIADVNNTLLALCQK
ncbi:hypothetical protein AHAS_Ahas13G0132400 [Arachis hypogaea]